MKQVESPCNSDVSAAPGLDTRESASAAETQHHLVISQQHVAKAAVRRAAAEKWVKKCCLAP